MKNKRKEELLKKLLKYDKKILKLKRQRKVWVGVAKSYKKIVEYQELSVESENHIRNVMLLSLAEVDHRDQVTWLLKGDKEFEIKKYNQSNNE